MSQREQWHSITTEIVRAAREATSSWGRTARTCALLTVVTVDWAVVQWMLPRH